METQILRQFFNRRNIVKNETVKDNDNEKKKTFSTMSADVAKHFSQQSAFHVRIMVFLGAPKFRRGTKHKLKISSKWIKTTTGKAVSGVLLYFYSAQTKTTSSGINDLNSDKERNLTRGSCAGSPTTNRILTMYHVYQGVKQKRRDDYFWVAFYRLLKLGIIFWGS